MRPLVFLPLFLTACVGTTGGDLVDFTATASGPPDATHAYAFQTPVGARVTLTKATVHIAAVYLTASAFNGTSANTSCVNPGRYVAQVPGSIDLDALSPTPQPFSVPGSGIAERALTGEVWLAGFGIDSPLDATLLVDVTGTAIQAGKTYPFEARVSIGTNRAIPASDPAQPGLNPICKQRIVSPISIAGPLVPSAAGTLQLEVDPRRWFTNVDFSQLDTSRPPPYEIPDSNDDVNGRNLFQGIRSGDGVYTFTFKP